MKSNERTTEATHEILGHKFTLEELALIAKEGIVGHVYKQEAFKEFRYTSVNVARFDKHKDEIEDYLEGWYEENMNSPESENKTYLTWICESSRVTTVDDLKVQLVWEYVESQAAEYLTTLEMQR